MNFHPRAPNAGAAEVAATVVAVEPAFDFGGADYRALHANSDATVFQSPAWLDALHRDVAPTFGATQATVTVRDQDLRLMMVLPLVRRRQHGVTIVEFADFGLCDYNAAVCDLDDAVLLDLGCNVAAARHRRDAPARFDDPHQDDARASAAAAAVSRRIARGDAVLSLSGAAYFRLERLARGDTEPGVPSRPRDETAQAGTPWHGRIRQALRCRGNRPRFRNAA